MTSHDVNQVPGNNKQIRIYGEEASFTSQAKVVLEDQQNSMISRQGLPIRRITENRNPPACCLDEMERVDHRNKAFLVGKLVLYFEVWHFVERKSECTHKI